MSGAIAYLLAEGMLNDADAKTSPLVTAGWGEWFGVRWVVLHGMTTGTLDIKPPGRAVFARSGVVGTSTGQRHGIVGTATVRRDE